MTNCAPDGVNVPDYIASNQRFTVDCTQNYGTKLGDPETVYAIDGNHYVPGKESYAPGGDVWTADAAIEIMKRESWSGMFLTFGGIDRSRTCSVNRTAMDWTPYTVNIDWPMHYASPTSNSAVCWPRSMRKAWSIGRSWFSPPIMAARRTSRTWATTETKRVAATRDDKPVRPPYWLEYLNSLAPSKLRTAYADTGVNIWLAERSPVVEATVTAGSKISRA
jgi:hypothetical protein